MTSGRTQFLEIVQKVEAGEQFNEILTSQLGRYQVQLFKGESLDCESIRSLYLSLDLKYLFLNLDITKLRSWLRTLRTGTNMRKKFLFGL